MSKSTSVRLTLLSALWLSSLSAMAGPIFLSYEIRGVVVSGPDAIAAVGEEVRAIIRFDLLSVPNSSLNPQVASFFGAVPDGPNEDWASTAGAILLAPTAGFSTFSNPGILQIPGVSFSSLLELSNTSGGDRIF